MTTEATEQNAVFYVRMRLQQAIEVFHVVVNVGFPVFTGHPRSPNPPAHSLGVKAVQSFRSKHAPTLLDKAFHFSQEIVRMLAITVQGYEELLRPIRVTGHEVAQRAFNADGVLCNQYPMFNSVV